MRRREFIAGLGSAAACAEQEARDDLADWP
jgi:hypothetical protein